MLVPIIDWHGDGSLTSSHGTTWFETASPLWGEFLHGYK